MDSPTAKKWTAVLIILAALLGASFACALPAEITSLVGPTHTPSLTPTSTSTPTPTPTPTPVPQENLESGQLALQIGDWDTALQAYSMALSMAQDPDVRARAQMGLGTTQLRAAQYSDALQTLTAFIQLYPGHELLADAFYLRARAYQYNGESALAVADYDRYLELRPGILEAVVRERSADLIWDTGLPMEAVERYRSAAAYTAAGDAQVLQVKIGQALQDAGDLEGALFQFEQVKQQSTVDSSKAAMNLLIGKILEEQGDVEGAYALYLESVQNYPDSYDTYLGLIALVEAGVEVDEFQRGLIDYNAGAFEPALAAFNRVLENVPDGTTLYYRGMTHLSLGDAGSAQQDFSSLIRDYPQNQYWVDAYAQKAVVEWAYLDLPDQAIQTYLEFVEIYPEHGFSPDMLFAAGRTAERYAMLEQAALIWTRIPEEYPGSTLAFQGAFEAGVVQFRLANFAGAREAFQLALEQSSDPGNQSKVLLWIGKTYQSEGNEEMTQTFLEDAARKDPTGYYSERARDILANRDPFTTDQVFSFPTEMEADRVEAEAWLKSTFNSESPGPLNGLSPAMEADIRIQQAREYWRLGDFQAARDSYEEVRLEVENDAEATYRLMHELLDQGLYRPAILACRQILNLAGMDDAATMSAPVYFNYIRFGPYFGEVLLQEAVDYGLEGLFLLSIARQESLFEPFITSYAAARGLMQVIPSTGAEIAGQLAWPAGYTEDDLYRAAVSARFGAYYLSRQRDLFGGDLFKALSAYNAGPGNTAGWDAIAPEDPDLFLEVIRLEQPHHYIRTIYEVFTIYRSLYASPLE